MKKTLMFKRIYIGIGISLLVVGHVSTYFYFKKEDVYKMTSSGIVEDKRQNQYRCGPYGVDICTNNILKINNQKIIVTTEAYESAVINKKIDLWTYDKAASRNLFSDIVFGVTFIIDIILMLFLIILLGFMIKWSVTKADEMSLNQYLKKYFW